MSETKTPPPPATGPAPEITYQVMPNAQGTLSQASAPAPSHPTGGGGSKWAYIIIGIVVLAVLGAVLYYFVGVGKKDTQTPVQSDTKLSQQFLSDNFGKTSCDDQTVCGDSADPDNDGLTNYMEFVKGTKAMQADTDSDGLADGDEANVYGTNPIKSITDTRAVAQENGYTDGASVKNGYDPLTPGDKFTETSLSQIQAKIAQFQLHAPTTTTLGLNADGSKAQ